MTRSPITPAVEVTGAPEVLATIDRLSPNGKLRIVDLVATEQDRFQAAINLMRSVIAVLPRSKHDPTLYHRQLSVYHLYRHEWNSAEDALAGRHEYAVRRYDILTLFLQGMAAWGKGRDFPEEIAERIVTLLHEQSATSSYPSDCQAVAISCWRVGKHDKACVFLRRAFDLASRPTGPILSYWRCRPVTTEEFRSDCVELKRMIETGEGRPAVFAIATN